ncbi:lipocalin family protein [Comamonas sp. GB3 AK4-5]|uniref:lipocalin family protein n=1 Tax=Comamonas sp. GB3 AK4-5 TaxID=3231487 RepID=UPI00351E1E84
MPSRHRPDAPDQDLSLPSSARLQRNASLLAVLALSAVGAAAWYALRRPPIPASVIPVSDFDLERFMGKWYEVARIDGGNEEALQRTQVEYARRANGSIRMEHRGYDPRKREWLCSSGRAKPVLGRDVGALKVSSFGPFYSGYNVVALDPKYRWAMVVGSQLDEFWILSRTPFLPAGLEDRLLYQARSLGVPVDQMQWVHQDGVNPTGSY